jgi:hypothetical protein
MITVTDELKIRTYYESLDIAKEQENSLPAVPVACGKTKRNR